MVVWSLSTAFPSSHHEPTVPLCSWRTLSRDLYPGGHQKGKAYSLGRSWDLYSCDQCEEGLQMISILLDFETKVEMAKLDKNPSCFFNNLSLFLFVSSSWIVSRSPRPLVQCVTSSGQIHWRSLDQKNQHRRTSVTIQ